MASSHVPRTIQVIVPEGTRYVMSYLKSGRTWLRFMLARYLADLYGLGVTVDLHSMFTIVPNNKDEPDRGLPAFAWRDRPGFPLIVCDHHLWEPFDPARNPSVVMVRSPADTLVSAYHMEVKEAARERVPISVYLRTGMGLARWVVYHNSLALMRSQPAVGWISYEQLTASPHETMATVLASLGVERDDRLIAAAVDAGRFDRMAEMERAHGFPGVDVAAGAGARRMRQGRVGGGAAQLSDADREYLSRQLSETLTPAARARLLALGCNL